MYLLTPKKLKEKWIVFILFLLAIFVVWIFLASLVSGQNFPQGFGFLKKLPIVSSFDCQEKSTGKIFSCFILADIEKEIIYLVVLDEKGNLHEILGMEKGKEMKSLWTMQIRL